MRRWLTCGLLLASLLAYTAGCAEKETVKETLREPAGNIPRITKK
jgi:hypothetical protein